MGKHKTRKDKVYVSAVRIEPCPFCKSDNIIVEMGSLSEGRCDNMILRCLGCHTRFELDMVCNGENIPRAFEFWNRR